MYQTEFDGKHHELGTSGFLYRSSKLMYDHATKSLWSTLQGRPVVGPLVAKDGEKEIRLNRRHVVTTTWGKWKARHPDTTVLSLNTGHRRDYGEGVAYRDYFATDELMFQVPGSDDRLDNKQSVFALRAGNEQLAISVDYLMQNRVYHDQLDGSSVVVFTDDGGANRAYESGKHRFVTYDGMFATDQQGNRWKVTESDIARAEQKLKRLPAHRAFWFGWVAQFPDTRLVK